MISIKKAGYNGIAVPALDIAMDGSGGGAGHLFISHAHSDHMPGNRAARSSKVYSTEYTTRLMKKRGFKGEVQIVDFEEPVQLPDANVTFYPAGHILGSAMTLIESEQGTILYTGDCRTPPSPATEGFKLPADREINCLVTEATFGLPVYRWPTHEELTEEIHSFARKTLEDNYTPVFLAYNLGKAQEIMHILSPLSRNGHAVQVHGAGYKLCPVYEEAGIDLGDYEPYDRDTCEGKILIAPTSALNSGFASNVEQKKIAYCSGWASREASRTQLSVDKLIPLSDHLDFFQLIEMCKTLDPDLIYLTHTPNATVVQHYLDSLNIPSRNLDMDMETDD